jgi:hypothetical protein
VGLVIVDRRRQTTAQDLVEDHASEPGDGDASLADGGCVRG